VERVVGGLADCARVLGERGPFDAVIHLAGGGGPAKIAADPIAGIRNNIRATSELARAARAAGVRRLLFASTIAVYGTERDHGRPYSEQDEALPDDIYGVVKEAAEQIWIDHAGGTAFRLSNIYGAGVGVDMGIAGAVERFARAAANSGEIRLFGGGKQRIDYVHIDDVARAFAHALERTDLSPHINIGGGDPIRLCDMAEICVGLAGELGNRVTVVEQPAPAGKSWPDRSLAIALADRELDWRPTTSYVDGLRELIRKMQTAPGGPS
jgi:UDP-glucose 4-epimerase